MIIELGKERYTANIDEQNNIIIVDGYSLPIKNKYGYVYKLYKRPPAIGCDGAGKALKRFFDEHLDFCVIWLLQICRFVKEYGVKTESKLEA